MVLNETDRKTRDERHSQLVKYCMISGALDLNLYAEYDVSVDCVSQMEKES